MTQYLMFWELLDCWGIMWLIAASFTVNHQVRPISAVLKPFRYVCKVVSNHLVLSKFPAELLSNVPLVTVTTGLIEAIEYLTCITLVCSSNRNLLELCECDTQPRPLQFIAICVLISLQS